MPFSERAVHIQITGEVQGVGYRYFARGAAQRLGVRGFVRNLPDGQVEAVAVGAAEAVDAFLAALRRGPAGSCVDQCAVTDLAEPGDHRAFVIAI